MGGIQDQIEDDVNGVLLADPADLGTFADALRRLLEAPQDAQRLGARARECVRAPFLGPRALLQYAELIGHYVP